MQLMLVSCTAVSGKAWQRPAGCSGFSYFPVSTHHGRTMMSGRKVGNQSVHGNDVGIAGMNVKALSYWALYILQVLYMYCMVLYIKRIFVFFIGIYT